MFDIVRRRSYDERRILIDSARILDSPFDDSPVCLSGAELELLRNLTQYLHRQDTFVATYYANHYLTPDVEAWDAIQAVVAGLEEKLMGSPNTLWGFKATWRDYDFWIDAGAGTQYVTSDAVAEGYVVSLEGLAFMDVESVCSRVVVYLKEGEVLYTLVDVANPAAGVWHPYNIHRTLEEGDVILFEFQGVTANDDLYWQVVGTQMEIT